MTVLPQAWSKVDGFLGTVTIFSNATQLGCVFIETSFSKGNTHICP